MKCKSEVQRVQRLNGESMALALLEECIDAVLSYCEAADRLRLACVCSRLTTVARLFRSVEVRITDDGKDKLSVPALASLFAGVPSSCVRLKVGCRNLTDEMLKQLLRALPYLEELDLSGCRLIRNDDTFHWIASHCPQLRRLDIGGELHVVCNGVLRSHMRCADDCMICLPWAGGSTGCGCVPVNLTHQYTVRSHLPALNTWTSRYTLTDSTLHAIGSLRHLTAVSLYDCLAVTEEGLKALVASHALTELNVGESVGHASKLRIRFTDSFVEAMSTSPCVHLLQRLSLRGCTTLSSVSACPGCGKPLTLKCALCDFNLL